MNEVEREIRAGVRAPRGRLLLKAPTGSGKSTRVPVMVGAEVEGRVIVVQPRRMAARLLAEFVASEVGTSLGGGVGYAVRFESKQGPETEILFVTDGVLQRMLLDDASLSGVGAVIFDEFHERRLASDLSLARVLDLQEGEREDLRVVVMSATLELGGLKGYLDPCELVEAGGRLFPVTVEYRGARPVGRRGVNRYEEVWDRVAAVVKAESRDLGAGDRILVFLPGMHEIRKSQSLLESSSVMRDWEVLPLYSALSPAAQAAAIRADETKRVVLSTNVAETSVTIEGVKVVVDSGLVRQSSYDVGRGLDSLRMEKIAQSSAEQRAGRAGRMGPGRCVRLWSETEQQGRREFELPEVRRVDLAEAVLFLKKLGVKEVADFRWLDEPEGLRLREAESLLGDLGALAEGELTRAGVEMAKLPMHPRLAALVHAGKTCMGEVLFIAAAVQGEGIFKRGERGAKWADLLEDEAGWRNDFAAEWLAMCAAKQVDFRPRECEKMGLLARGARETWRSFQQLMRMMKGRGFQIKEPDFRQRGEDCARAMFLAFGDRLALRRDQGSVVCDVAGGRRGKLHSKSAVKKSGLFLATEMMEVEGRERVVQLSRGVAVAENWVPEEEVKESENVIFDEVARRVVAVRRRSYRGLVLEEKRGGKVDVNLAGSLLAQRVIAGELALKRWDAKVEGWIARLVFLSAAMPELELPGFSDDDRELAMGQVCAGATTFKEVKERDPWGVLNEWLSAPQKQALETFAPEKMTLENGVNTRVRYALGSDPWCEEKVQRLYGVKETPVIANGHALVVKILAPNQRAWQVTSDLRGFWERGFPQMKKDLAGRYPKHNWEGH